MELVFTIAILCLLLTICTDLIKRLQISRFFVPSKSSPNTQLEEELKEAQSNLEETRNTTNTRGEYAQFVRIMRAEQRVKDIREKLRTVNSKNRLKSASLEFAIAYGCKVLLSIMLSYTCLCHLYDPVLVFGDHINLQPLQGILSSPTGVPNAISVPMWSFACHTVFRHAYKTLLYL